MKICSHYSCDREVEDTSKFCPTHEVEFLLGELNRCPECGRYKKKKYAKCYECLIGTTKDSDIVKQKIKGSNSKEAVKKKDDNTCPICGGVGYRMASKRPNSNKATIRVTCSQCLGRGFISEKG